MVDTQARFLSTHLRNTCTHRYMSLLKNVRENAKFACLWNCSVIPWYCEIADIEEFFWEYKTWCYLICLEEYQLGYLKIIARLVKIGGYFSVGWRKSEARPVQAWWWSSVRSPGPGPYPSFWSALNTRCPLQETRLLLEHQELHPSPQERGRAKKEMLLLFKDTLHSQNLH